MRHATFPVYCQMSILSGWVSYLGSTSWIFEIGFEFSTFLKCSLYVFTLFRDNTGINRGSILPLIDSYMFSALAGCIFPFSGGMTLPPGL